jgi:hypothetical protein
LALSFTALATSRDLVATSYCNFAELIAESVTENAK